MEGINATRYFQALRRPRQQENKLIGGKENLTIIDEAHYTTQTHAWQGLALSSEFQHKNARHAADPCMGRSNTEARFKI